MVLDLIRPRTDSSAFVSPSLRHFISTNLVLIRPTPFYPLAGHGLGVIGGDTVNLVGLGGCLPKGWWLVLITTGDRV